MLAPLLRTFAVVSWVNSFLLKPCPLSPRTGPMDRVPSVALKVSEWKPSKMASSCGGQTAGQPLRCRFCVLQYLTGCDLSNLVIGQPLLNWLRLIF